MTSKNKHGTAKFHRFFNENALLKEAGSETYASKGKGTMRSQCWQLCIYWIRLDI